MKILYIGWGFSPFRMGGSLRYAESVMEGMAVRGNTVGYFCSGRFSLPPRRASTLKTWTRGAVTMFEVRDSPIVPGWGLGTKDPRAEIACPPLREHLDAVLAGFRPDVVHIHDLQAMSADLVDAVKARGIPVLYSLHDYGPLCPTFFLFRHDRIVCDDYRDGEECVKCSVQAPRDAFAFRCALGAHSLFGHRGGTVISAASSAAKAFLRKASAGGEARYTGDAAGFVARRKAFVRALSSVDLLLPVSQRVADLYSAYGVAGPKVRVLHPLLPHHEKIRPVERTSREGGKVRFGYLGALMPAKGIEVLLEAYGRMERKGAAELRLHGPCDARYRKDLARRFPEGMAGYRGAFRPDQLQEILSGIDVGVFPSVCEETYGMVAVEFLRAGILVIASRIGGIPEVVRECEGGMLVSPGDATEFSGAMDHIAIVNKREMVVSTPLKPKIRFSSHLDILGEVYKLTDRFDGGHLSVEVPTPGPIVSVVTPSYNSGPFLRETLESLAAQTYRNFEHIVVDGGSTDDTIEILKEYEGKYPLQWISEKDRGQADAINKGMRMARGDILAYLNADDLYYPQTIERIVRYFSYNPLIKAVFGRCNVVDHAGLFMHEYENSDHLWGMSREKRSAPTFACLLKQNSGMIPQPSAFWKREVMEKVGFFDESFHYTMDYEYWLRISKVYPFGFIDEILAAFRFHDVSKSGSLAVHRFMREAIRAARMHGGSMWSGVTWTFVKVYLFALFRYSAYQKLIKMLFR